MEDFLMVPCDATDDAREEDEMYYTSYKWLGRKKHVSATHLLTHYWFGNLREVLQMEWALKGIWSFGQKPVV